MDIEERGVRLRLTIVDTPGEKYRLFIIFFTLTKLIFKLFAVDTLN